MLKMKRNAILHFCMLISLLLVVRCDQDEEDDELSDEKIVSYDDTYVPPTAEYSTDPKIISRDVKCLGKTMKVIL